MMNTLRSLERRLVRERTEIGVPRIVDRFLRCWDHALTRNSSLPDPLDFINTLVHDGFYLPASHDAALQYLAKCRRAASLPDRDHLLRLLLPRGRLRGPPPVT